MQQAYDERWERQGLEVQEVRRPGGFTGDPEDFPLAETRVV